ncbi:4-carboxy-4-hydroxy-2-oxoadipate aldolase/oxaloacetate decarboxylase [Salinigranum salinum]|uniref:4-carboxy-4-hydroxy-2-oxoadipate aldolase/oxaloacetate decarboxylase n=1 Tax=Salinigranum salinum TaxID=1364937 RepID=UPI001260B2A7|nr:4-carboxy-4-hydroxy-2-oxoadipate aldolase/oxaloacetate decarboxylase [Salinigranum salinum]
MSLINPDVDRLDRELVESFEGIPTAILSDVLGARAAVMDSGIDPIYSGIEMAGTALTVKAVPGDNLIIHKAITVAEPGDVIVIDGKGYTETAYLGELMSASCEAHDLSGIIVDGAIRDRAEIEEIGFPVYARGVHPKGPLKHAPGSINVPVTCGGATVAPGDIVVGDDEGVVVVPPNDVEATLESAREKQAAERILRERVEDGEYLYDIGNYDEVLEDPDVTEPDDSVS